MIKLPFSFLPPRMIEWGAHKFEFIGGFLEPFFPMLKLSLRQAEIPIHPKQYISACLFSAVAFFFAILVTYTSIFYLMEFDSALLLGPTVALGLMVFMLFQYISYPKILINRRVRDIDKNLLFSLRNILIQVGAGVPLFSVFVNISGGDYGAISSEFKKAVKEINGGKDAIEVLERMAIENPSPYFRKSIWQLSNAMKAGSDSRSTLEEIINNLGKEQLVQIQNYGSQLNPLSLMYMMMAVIVPSLGVTFLIVLSSIAVSSSVLGGPVMFIGLYFAVLVFQIMFMGMIKTKRPGLLGD